jgi:capsular polysaccharide biosynthesis protein
MGAVLRQLPGTSAAFGPPRRSVLTLRYFIAGLHESRGYSYQQVFPAALLERQVDPHSASSNIHPEFGRERCRSVPECGVAVLPRGRFLTDTGFVVSADDSLIQDVSATFGVGEGPHHPIFLRPKLPKLNKIPGRVALVTVFRSDIYYHWIFDTLPRLHLIEKLGLEYDLLAIPHKTRFQRESLDLLGISRDKLLNVSGYVEAETLIVPTQTGVVGNPPPWVCHYLRDNFLPRDAGTSGERLRIFISRERAKTRVFLNEPELFDMLASYGFRKISAEDLSFVEQVELFTRAEIVVTPHGSGETNLVFCAPGTQVIEIFSPNYVVVPYWTLCNILDLDYSYVIGRGRQREERGRRVHESIDVDVDEVKKVLEGALRGLDRPMVPRRQPESSPT